MGWQHATNSAVALFEVFFSSAPRRRSFSTQHRWTATTSHGIRPAVSDFLLCSCSKGIRVVLLFKYLKTRWKLLAETQDFLCQWSSVVAPKSILIIFQILSGLTNEFCKSCLSLICLICPKPQELSNKNLQNQSPSLHPNEECKKKPHPQTHHETWKAPSSCRPKAPSTSRLPLGWACTRTTSPTWTKVRRSSRWASELPGTLWSRRGVGVGWVGWVGFILGVYRCLHYRLKFKRELGLVLVFLLGGLLGIVAPKGMPFRGFYAFVLGPRRVLKTWWLSTGGKDDEGWVLQGGSGIVCIFQRLLGFCPWHHKTRPF